MADVRTWSSSAHSCFDTGRAQTRQSPQMRPRSTVYRKERRRNLTSPAQTNARRRPMKRSAVPGFPSLYNPSTSGHLILHEALVTTLTGGSLALHQTGKHHALIALAGFQTGSKLGDTSARYTLGPRCMPALVVTMKLHGGTTLNDTCADSTTSTLDIHRRSMVLPDEES